jgi:putative transcriptional regulator
MNKASKAGSRILQGAKEALAIARGEADPSTYRVHVPAEVNVKSIRRRLKITQDEFARRFAIPPGHAAGLGTGPPASRGTGADVAAGH